MRFGSTPTSRGARPQCPMQCFLDPHGIGLQLFLQRPQQAAAAATSARSAPLSSPNERAGLVRLRAGTTIRTAYSVQRQRGERAGCAWRVVLGALRDGVEHDSVLNPHHTTPTPRHAPTTPCRCTLHADRKTRTYRCTASTRVTCHSEWQPVVPRVASAQQPAPVARPTGMNAVTLKRDKKMRTH